jgi:predicted PilT family ATPase
VEGEHDRYLEAKEAIEQIIRENRKPNDPVIHIGEKSPFGPPMCTLEVPDKFVGLIIGKSGENLKQISSQTSTKIFMPQKNSQSETSGVRIVEICGEDMADCEDAERRIKVMIEEQ